MVNAIEKNKTEIAEIVECSRIAEIENVVWKGNYISYRAVREGLAHNVRMPML